MKTSDEMSRDILTADFSKSLSAHRSRRTLLKGAAIGAAGIAAVSAGALLAPKGAVHASGSVEGAEDSIVQILSIAATAEQLAVTFYSNGIANASKLGISGANLDYLVAALVEEQLHQNFLVAAGGTAVTSTFSFPEGPHTFENMTTFVDTLQQLETAFEAAYLAAISEFALMGQARLAQVAGQILAIESEHRALGRSINPNLPFANNWAYAPALIESVGDAVGVLSSEGYLSPVSGNSYTYKAVSTDNMHVIYRNPVAPMEDND